MNKYLRLILETLFALLVAVLLGVLLWMIVTYTVAPMLNDVALETEIESMWMTVVAVITAAAFGYRLNDIVRDTLGGEKKPVKRAAAKTTKKKK